MRSVLTGQRVCLACDTILSCYNPGRRCAACVKSGKTEKVEPPAGTVTLGQKVADHRTRVRLTQHDLAARAGVSVLLVRSLEGGDRDTVLLRSLFKVLRVLGMRIAALDGAGGWSSERVRAARHERGLTLRGLARDCGLAVMDLSDLESGKRVLTRAPTAGVLANALGLSVAEVAPWLLEPDTTQSDSPAPGVVVNLTTTAADWA